MCFKSWFGHQEEELEELVENQRHGVWAVGWIWLSMSFGQISTEYRFEYRFGSCKFHTRNLDLERLIAAFVHASYSLHRVQVQLARKQDYSSQLRLFMVSGVFVFSPLSIGLQ